MGLAEALNEINETTDYGWWVGKPATISVEEAAIVLGIGRRLAYESVRRGEIPVIRMGKRMLVPTEGLRRLLAGEMK